MKTMLHTDFEEVFMVPETVEDRERSLTVTRAFTYEFEGQTHTIQPGEYRAIPVGHHQGPTPPPTPDIDWALTTSGRRIAILPAEIVEQLGRDGTLSFSA